MNARQRKSSLGDASRFAAQTNDTHLTREVVVSAVLLPPVLPLLALQAVCGCAQHSPGHHRHTRLRGEGFGVHTQP